jgi:hypothetical protein
MPMIGFIAPRSPDGMTERLRGFRQGLKDTGYVEGDNVAVEYRWAEGPSKHDRADFNLPALSYIKNSRSRIASIHGHGRL